MDTDFTYNMIAQLQDSIMNYTILIALPLLLFSLNLKKWLRNARSTILSLIIAMFSLLASIFIGYYLFAHNITDASKVTGMLIGVYTGGTPNLAAIGTCLLYTSEHQSCRTGALQILRTGFYTQLRTQFH